MTPGCNNFNYFPENQLTIFKLCPPTWYSGNGGGGGSGGSAPCFVRLAPPFALWPFLATTVVLTVSLVKLCNAGNVSQPLHTMK